MSVFFAATHPDRVRSLVLYGTAARYSQKLPDFPWGFTPAEIESQFDEIDSRWGEGALADLYYGATADTPGVREMFGKLQRAMVSPTMAKLWWKAFMEIDVRGVLAAVRAPTLVLARPGDWLVCIEAAAALAAAIPEAHFQPLPPGPHAPFDIVGHLVPSIVEFVCEKPSERADERILKTIMFTDIVGSTEQLSATGDAHWRHQLNAHDKVVDWLLEKYGGHRVKHTGDGVFALFDGPTKAAHCALEMVPALATRGIRIRAGVHTGECERRGEEWSGMAVHTGARIGALASAGEVLVSRTVRDLSAGSGTNLRKPWSATLQGPARRGRCLPCHYTDERPNAVAARRFAPPVLLPRGCVHRSWYLANVRNFANFGCCRGFSGRLSRPQCVVPMWKSPGPWQSKPGVLLQFADPATWRGARWNQKSRQQRRRNSDSPRP
jgi:class 3 adenylate cyclase